MNPEAIFWPAPAKLNLMLRVVGRRADGYHRLQTVFQFLDLADELRFSLLPQDEILCPMPGIPPDDNLAVRAARALRPYRTIAQGVRIEIRKRLPMGGGLGGGSSNAATTLVVLNRLWQCGLDTPALARIGLSLGADVPIFVHGRAAWAEGVGERFTPIEPPQPWYLVVRPPCSVSTAEIFSAPELTRNAPPIKIRDFLAGRDENTLEPVVRQRHPEVDRALKWLDGLGRGRLTGTGSCVFAAFADEGQAQAALAGLPPDFEGFVARGCNRSPLHEKMDQHLGVSPSG